MQQLIEAAGFTCTRPPNRPYTRVEQPDGTTRSTFSLGNHFFANVIWSKEQHAAFPDFPRGIGGLKYKVLPRASAIGDAVCNRCLGYKPEKRAEVTSAAAADKAPLHARFCECATQAEWHRQRQERKEAQALRRDAKKLKARTSAADAAGAPLCDLFAQGKCRSFRFVKGRPRQCAGRHISEQRTLAPSLHPLRGSSPATQRPNASMAVAAATTTPRLETSAPPTRQAPSRLPLRQPSANLLTKVTRSPRNLPLSDPPLRAQLPH